VGGVIESLMVACPTVATSVCGMVDCVIDGETGIQVRPSDPADLARGINAMLADRSRARAMAARGRALMQERFSLARTCRDLDQLYCSERSALRRRFYNPFAIVWRCIVGIPVLAWFVCRVAYRDFYLPSHWPVHRQRLDQFLDTALSLDTYWRPPTVRISYLPLRIRWANRRVTAGLYVARWRVEFPMYSRVYRQRLISVTSDLLASIRGRVITARLRLARLRIEAPMYARMYRHQLTSWIGSHAPGWGVLRRAADLRRRIQKKSVVQVTSSVAVIEPHVRDRTK